VPCVEHLRLPNPRRLDRNPPDGLPTIPKQLRALTLMMVCPGKIVHGPRAKSQQGRIATDQRAVPAATISSRVRADRRQPRQLQRPDRRRRVRSAVFAVHLQISGADHRPRGKRRRCLRSQTGDQRGHGGVRAEEGRFRAEASPHEPADPARRRDLSRQTADSDPRWPAHVRERLEPALRRAAGARSR
jgi:hypothetical protein